MEKLLFVLNNMNIGGTEKAFLNLIDTLPEDQYDITLLLLEKTGGYYDLIPDRVKVIEMEDYNRRKPEIMDPPLKIVKQYLQKKKFRRAVDLAFAHLIFKLTGNRTLYYKMVLKGYKLEQTFDKAIAYCGPFDFITVLTLKCIRAKEKIQWIHFDVSKFQFNVGTCRNLYPQFYKIYAVSDAARMALVEKLPAIEKIAETRLNVVSREKCRQMADQGDGFVDSYQGIRIMTVGRLSKEKGQDIIPLIAERLKQKGIDFIWYLIGDGKLRSKIEQLSEETGTQDNLVFLGTQINPYQYLKGTDLYVQTSIHEGYCITLAEAKAFDLPIVSTECAGAHEQLDELNNCIVVERSVEKMTAALLKLLENIK